MNADARRWEGKSNMSYLRASAFICGSLLCLAFAVVALAEETTLEPVQVGSPTKLEVFPAQVKLLGNRQRQQLVVTGHYADGTVQDLTRAATYASSAANIATIDNAVLKPVANGSAEITVSAGGQQAKAAVEVVNFEQPDPLSFEQHALASLSKQGCNAGACHGSPSGKGGFRLSLRAFDPKLDEKTLLREEFGRRLNHTDPDASLLLAKPLMKVPHGGGMKLKKTDFAYGVLRDWIAEGCKLDSAGAPRCVKIEVYPPSGRELKRPAHTQQLTVRAHLSDGSIRDVTELAVFTSSDADVASVNEHGFVVGRDRGETAIVVRYMEFIESTFITFVKDIEGFAWKDPPVNNYIDEHVNAKLKKLKYLPSETCSDEEFLRRVHFDLIGIPLSVADVNAFLADPSPTKRAALVDQLLERPEFAKFWALKWGDLLKLTTAAVGDEGVHKYHRWVEQAFASNMPYDQFARELLTASGSTLAQPQANFYRTSADANECVENISQVFLGARLQCAKCHNHPFERWTQDNYYGMAAFFNRVQRKKSSVPGETIVWIAKGGEVTQPRTQQQMKPWLPLTGSIDGAGEDDRRAKLAEWLIKPDNPFFAKVEVNRLWSQLFGRGLVEPNDDFRESNPPANAELLAALAKDFAEHKFDRKHVLKTICNSRTYQTSFRTNDFNKSDIKYNSHYQPRLLSAEQLLDAICQLADVPEKFGSLPEGTKATQLPAPDMAKSEFLKIFGQPERQTVCACERSNESNLGMAIQFFNGPLVYGKLRDPNNRFRRLMNEKKSDEEIVTELYLAGVSRKPTAKELDVSLKHISSKPDRAAALEDVCWAILNTNEFLFQH
jgi:hypothetical protein